MAQEATIGRIVTYRSRVGGYDLPAIITATEETLHEPGVELYRASAAPDLVARGKVDLNAEGVPPLSSPDHVHLTVFSPGLPGNAEVEGLDANRGGSYREWNVPLDEPTVTHSPVPGVASKTSEPRPGSWRWPERR